MCRAHQVGELPPTEENICRQCSLIVPDDCRCRCRDCGSNTWPHDVCGECQKEEVSDE